MEPVTLLLVDDNPRFLSAASSFLGNIDDLVLLSTLEGGAQAVATAKELQPDVILVDLAMPDIAGLQLIPQLRESMPDLGIIALTVHDNPQYREAALKAGADAFITKSSILKKLEPTIKEVRSAHAPEPEFVGELTRRILVMDDDPGLRDIYQKALRHKGHDVDLAATLDEARAMINDRMYGVFICDIHMGDERGTDLLAELGHTLKARGTEIIMASAHGQYRFITEDYGSDFFLEKPVSIHTLVTLIERILNNNTAQEQVPSHTPAEVSTN